MPDIITTANGRSIDMDALRLKNEKTVAVGNMKVNARGDEIDPITGTVYRSRNERVNDHYKLHTVIPKDEAPAKSSKPSVAKPAAAAPAKKAAAPKPEIKKEVIVDNAIDPDTWVDTPPAPAPVVETVSDAPAVEVVSRREIVTVDGPAVEIEYSDGSMEIVPKTTGSRIGRI